MKAKVNKVDSTVIKREMFEDSKSYKYFLRAFEMAKTIQDLKDAGNLIFHKKELITDDFYLKIDKDGTFPALGTCYTSNSMTTWIGSTMGNINNTIYVYKKELNEFNHFSYVEVSNKHKLVLA